MIIFVTSVGSLLTRLSARRSRLHRLTCVVPEVTSIRVRVKGEAGAQFQPHAGEILMVRQLPVAHHGRPGAQRSRLQVAAFTVTHT